MKLGIVGSRRRNLPVDKDLIRRKILVYNPDIIISGGCSEGADRFAEELAVELGISIIIFRPNLNSFGGTATRYEIVNAYYERNKKIAIASDRLLALVAPDRKGGTENTIKYFKKIGKDKMLEIL